MRLGKNLERGRKDFDVGRADTVGIPSSAPTVEATIVSPSEFRIVEGVVLVNHSWKFTECEGDFPPNRIALTKCVFHDPANVVWILENLVFSWLGTESVEAIVPEMERHHGETTEIKFRVQGIPGGRRGLRVEIVESVRHLRWEDETKDVFPPLFTKVIVFPGSKDVIRNVRIHRSLKPFSTEAFSLSLVEWKSRVLHYRREMIERMIRIELRIHVWENGVSVSLH